MKGFLQDQNGDWSSKRLVGLAYALLGIIIVLFGVFKGKDINMEVLLVVVGTCLSALGISNFTKTIDKK